MLAVLDADGTMTHGEATGSFLPGSSFAKTAHIRTPDATFWDSSHNRYFIAEY